MLITCRNGHPIKESRVTPNGYKRCRTCERNGRNRYYESHKEERARINALNDRRLRLKRRLAILDFLGGKCVICGFSDHRALHIDHVNGGGTKERKSIRGQAAKYRHIKNNPKLFQLLCANHNMIKVWENNERTTKYEI